MWCREKHAGRTGCLHLNLNTKRRTLNCLWLNFLILSVGSGLNVNTKTVGGFASTRKSKCTDEKGLWSTTCKQIDSMRYEFLKIYGATYIFKILHGDTIHNSSLFMTWRIGTYIYLYIYMYVYIYIYMYMYICIYIYIHIYIEESTLAEDNSLRGEQKHTEHTKRFEYGQHCFKMRKQFY